MSARLGFDLLADAAYYAIAMYLYTFDLLADVIYYYKAIANTIY